MEVFDIAAIVGAAAASTLAAFAWLARKQNGQPLRHATQPDTGQRVTLLFEDEDLHHVSDLAARTLEVNPGRDTWAGVREKLLGRFPSLPEQARNAGDGKTIIAAAQTDDAATLQLMRSGSFLRVSMFEDGQPTPAQTMQIKAMQREIAHLKRASETTPHAIWQVDRSGMVTWSNAAYADLYARLYKTQPDPKTPVFEIKADGGTVSERQRVSTQSPGDDRKDWYDVSVIEVDAVRVFHAVDVNAVVRSETAQRNFVQTLAKTFAQLSIGLAIFDRNGQLALFNPALIDLTKLPADFLSGRPTLMSFFDRIRENRRMPEPKNYSSWRQQIAEVIVAATDGRYQETWSLETGQTYRVKGRPHPDGAIAFLIEDISAEISLTRNFRAELELGQSLMDTFDDALAVFSSSGILTFCNLAYRELWGMDPDNSFAEVSIADCVAVWKGRSTPGARWAALTDFVLDFGERSTWELPVATLDGKALTCSVARIASGATVLRFTETARTNGTKKAGRAKIA